MTYLIRGKNFEIGDRTKEKIEAVINGIEKILPEDAFVNVAVNRGKLTAFFSVVKRYEVKSL